MSVQNATAQTYVRAASLRAKCTLPYIATEAASTTGSALRSTAAEEH
ncbi:MAG: hypothetical protein WCH98_06085 [Verrucomicrobiota bacterium]